MKTVQLFPDDPARCQLLSPHCCQCYPRFFLCRISKSNPAWVTQPFSSSSSRQGRSRLKELWNLLRTWYPQKLSHSSLKKGLNTPGKHRSGRSRYPSSSLAPEIPFLWAILYISCVSPCLVLIWSSTRCWAISPSPWDVSELFAAFKSAYFKESGPWGDLGRLEEWRLCCV